jgi:hypothetical protein
LNNFEFVNPENGLNEPDYEVKADEINIFLVGEDKFHEPPFDEKFVNIVTLINQSPIYLLQSTKNAGNKVAQYQKGNSFHFIIERHFKATGQEDRLEQLELDVLSDGEFHALNNGLVQYAITWNHWRIEEFENVRHFERQIPIRPFGWTCLITKKEELQNESKLELMELLSKRIIKNINMIYRFYERKIYSIGNDDNMLNEFISIIEKSVAERDKRYVPMALKTLATDRIWTSNPIYMAEKVTDFTDYLLDESDKKATKSAVAEIVNRNYSHHIGSHVSHRATFDKIIERIGLQPADILGNASYFHTIIQMVNKLNRYKDERNEFISAIAAGSGIQSARFYDDVLLPFIENSLLMDNIAANEGINYGETNKLKSLQHNRLKIRCQINGQDISSVYIIDNQASLISDDLPYFKPVSNYNDNFYKERRNCIQDIVIGIPGPLGKHALYSILENYIRNTVKHSPKEKMAGKDVIITLLIHDDGSDKYQVLLSDNVSYISDDGLKKLQDGIRTPIKKKEKLGIQDMKINACLLAGKEITEHNCQELRVAKKRNGILYYRFSILKAKKIALFTSKSPLKPLEKEGIYFYKSLAEFEKVEINQTFQFAVFDTDIIAGPGKLNSISCCFPNRLLINSCNVEENQFVKSGKCILFNDPALFQVTDADELIARCWRIWLSRWTGQGTEVGVHLYLDQQKNDSPTKEWILKEEIINERLHGIAKFSTWFTEGSSKKSKLKRISDNHILYDRHGWLLKSDYTLAGLNFLNSNSYHLIDKNSRDFDRIFNANIGQENTELPFELIESGMFRILLIDERVQERSLISLKSGNDREWQVERNGFEKGEFNLFDALWASKIFCVSHISVSGGPEVPLKTETDDAKDYYLKLYISKNENGEVKISFKQNFETWNIAYPQDIVKEEFTSSDIAELNVDAIIIHRTILKDLIAKLGDDLIDKISQQIPFFYITTGGGVAHDVKYDLNIIPFATIQDCILNNNRIAKLGLTQTLMNLTRNKF